jgi:hypothetical protein
MEDDTGGVPCEAGPAGAGLRTPVRRNILRPQSIATDMHALSRPYLVALTYAVD